MYLYLLTNIIQYLYRNNNSLYFCFIYFKHSNNWNIFFTSSEWPLISIFIPPLIVIFAKLNKPPFSLYSKPSSRSIFSHIISSHLFTIPLFLYNRILLSVIHNVYFLFEYSISFVQINLIFSSGTRKSLIGIY